MISIDIQLSIFWIESRRRN
uniref:Uncharacterized protein LOC8274077 n=1 Tax=Rhizophora mucronata TaxID=61149 RepID=A0A2P2M923_RHIMU